MRHAAAILKIAAFATVALGFRPTVGAQGTKRDYERADGLKALTEGKVFRANVDPHWFDDNNKFWYRNDLADGAREFIVVDAVKGERRPAFDHAKLAEALAIATSKPQRATHLPFQEINFVGDGTISLLDVKTAWSYDPLLDVADEIILPELPMAQAARPEKGTQAAGEVPSPDGRWVAFIRDYNVHIREVVPPKSPLADAPDENRPEVARPESFPLSFDGTEGESYSYEWIGREERRPKLIWSPDSRKLVAVRKFEVQERKIYFVNSSPEDQLQPKLRWKLYAKPGDRIPTEKPHLFEVETRREIPIRDDLFSKPWTIDGYRWSPNSGHFTFEYNQRGHQAFRVIAVDAEDGTTRATIDERSETFIDYAHKHFAHHLDETAEVVWMSERDGWNHLYVIDARTGRVKNPVTRGDWAVSRVDQVDEANRRAWFWAQGIVPGQDPYYFQLARANLDGSGLVILTGGNGSHEALNSPDHRFFIDKCSRVDLAPVTTLRRIDDGKLVCELERADVSALLAAGWKAPERFDAKGRDGTTDIYGVIFRPSNFDPAKKYPVIEQIYAGPHGFAVPKRFAAYHEPQALAELGFIVVQIDGMGTSGRSKAFHDVCWKNLADAGFPDRILWLKAAAEKEPAMDLSRVGIYGGSAGGQNALGALLFHGDFYKAAAADCGCHDNRMDKIWWNELWMGWPVGPHYAAQSNVTNAHKLTGKLLLTVGELDENVDPASTMQVVNALIKADKDFELIVFPGAGHGAGSGAYGRRRMRDFFVRNLLGVEPRRDE